MTDFASFGLLGGGLQVGVGAYALRLHRFFGVRRVGWLIVAAFLLLTLLHLLVPMHERADSSGINGMANLLIVLLIIIGLAHAETLFAAQDRTRQDTHQLRLDAEKDAQQCGVLTDENKQLRRELADAQHLAVSLESKAALLEPYHLLFTENPRPMWAFDLRSFRVLAVNQAALRVYGLNHKQFLTRPVTEICPREDERIFGNMTDSDFAETSRRVCPHRRQDGTALELEIAAHDVLLHQAPVRLIVAEDVTDRKQGEAIVRQADYSQALHRCAGVVARHLNHPVAALHNQVAMLLVQSPSNPEVGAGLTQVFQTVQHLAERIRQLLVFGDPPALQVEALDLGAMLESWRPAIARSAGERVSLQISAGNNVPAMLADAELLKFVILNLVSNAREAMPQGGVLSLRTSTVCVGKSSELEPGRAKPGEYVCLAVQDTGCGMNLDAQARLFEPLYSTRSEAQGLGIGLANVSAIVKQHGGWVDVLSQPYQGTRFRVIIPAAPRPVDAALSKPVEARGTGTILLVDVDDRCRALARHYLTREGYRVVEAACGATAAVLWERLHAEVDLLLTDAALAGGTSTGYDLADQFKQSKPTLKVVYTTSPSQGETAPKSMDSKPVMKPFTAQTLIEAVRGCLNSPA
jgi:two-component system cell cycle sensor histidine kinase/response regulator CckA